MKKTIDILIFSISILLLSVTLNAAPIKITQDDAVTIVSSGTSPVTVSTNFDVLNANLIVTNDSQATLTLLKKGFIIAPKKSNYKATVVLTARNGSIYAVNMSGGGKRAVFRLEDPIQDFDKFTKKFDFESGKIDQDARNIIKGILLEKKISGFKKSDAYQMVNNGQYNLERIERYTGGKYIVDRWKLTNTSGDSLYFIEEDFYTNGILAVALEKNRILDKEEVFLILMLNKHSIYEVEKRAK